MADIIIVWIWGKQVEASSKSGECAYVERAVQEVDVGGLTYDKNDTSRYCHGENTQLKTRSFCLIVMLVALTRVLRSINGTIIIPNFDIKNRIEYGGTQVEWPLSGFITEIRLYFTKREYYAIHFRWLGPNHVNATASEAEMALQLSTHEREKKAWKWEKFVAKHVKYHMILGNIMEYRYQGLNLVLESPWHLRNQHYKLLVHLNTFD